MGLNESRSTRSRRWFNARYTRYSSPYRSSLYARRSQLSVQPGVKYILRITWKRKSVSAKMPREVRQRALAFRENPYAIRDPRSNFDLGTDSMIISKISR